MTERERERLDALRYVDRFEILGYRVEAAVIRAALRGPEVSEPVAWGLEYDGELGCVTYSTEELAARAAQDAIATESAFVVVRVPLYATPSPRGEPADGMEELANAGGHLGDVVRNWDERQGLLRPASKYAAELRAALAQHVNGLDGRLQRAEHMLKASLGHIPAERPYALDRVRESLAEIQALRTALRRTGGAEQ